MRSAHWAESPHQGLPTYWKWRYRSFSGRYQYTQKKITGPKVCYISTTATKISITRGSQMQTSRKRDTKNSLKTV